MLLVICLMSRPFGLSGIFVKVELIRNRGVNTMLGTILIVVLILMLLGAIPAWPHSRQWGYYPSGGLGLIILILVILVLTGRL